MVFKIAASLAFKKAMADYAGPYEPVMNVEVRFEECLGDVMGDFNSRPAASWASTVGKHRKGPVRSPRCSVTP